MPCWVARRTTKGREQPRTTGTFQRAGVWHVLGEALAHLYVQWYCVHGVPIPYLLTGKTALPLEHVVHHREVVSSHTVSNARDRPEAGFAVP